MTTKKLLGIIDNTIAWASDVSDIWTGTLFEKLIDLQQAQLIKAVEEEDFQRAYTLMCDLGQTLDNAVQAYEQ